MPQSCTFTLEGHTDGVTCLAHSTQHKKLLTGSLDRTIKVVFDIGFGLWELGFAYGVGFGFEGS
eukprot:452675-Rhodomonas_salina.3